MARFRNSKPSGNPRGKGRSGQQRAGKPTTGRGAGPGKGPAKGKGKGKLLGKAKSPRGGRRDSELISPAGGGEAGFEGGFSGGGFSGGSGRGKREVFQRGVKRYQRKRTTPRGPERKLRERPEEGDRLQKVLAGAGVGSRRECEQYIVDGRVEVDRKVVTELGTRVDPSRQEIRVDGTALVKPPLVYLLLNKPRGVLSTNYDPEGRARVIDLVNSPQRLYAVGRLDQSSEGMVLLTNDGDLTFRLTHPRYGVGKTYWVQVVGRPSNEELKRLRQGVHLAEGKVQVDSLRIRKSHPKSTILEIVLKEGKNREIRRVLARVGHKVVRLKRVAIGPLRLGDLPEGAYRKLEADEIKLLERIASAQPKPKERPKPKPAAERTADAPPKPTPSRPKFREDEPIPTAKSKTRGSVIGIDDAEALGTDFLSEDVSFSDKMLESDGLDLLSDGDDFDDE